MISVQQREGEWKFRPAWILLMRIHPNGNRDFATMPSIEAMEKEKKEIWFPAKKYGVGWGVPVTWQDWLVFLMFILLVLVGVLILKISRSPFLVAFFPIYIMILSGVLMYICWKKGEDLEFRWGNKKSDKLNIEIEKDVKVSGSHKK